MHVNPQIHVLRFDKKSFFNTILGFTTNWVYKKYANVYYSEKNRNLSTIDKIDLKCDCINGSVINGVRRPILFSFVLDKPAGYKVFCEPETIQYKKN